jgi:hypothetical protein
MTLHRKIRNRILPQQKLKRDCCSSPIALRHPSGVDCGAVTQATSAIMSSHMEARYENRMKVTKKVKWDNVKRELTVYIVLSVTFTRRVK